MPEFSKGQFWRQPSENDVIVTLRRRTCCMWHVFALCGKLSVFETLISELVNSREVIYTSLKRRHFKLLMIFRNCCFRIHSGGNFISQKLILRVKCISLLQINGLRNAWLHLESDFRELFYNKKVKLTCVCNRHTVPLKCIKQFSKITRFRRSRDSNLILPIIMWTP